MRNRRVPSGESASKLKSPWSTRWLRTRRLFAFTTTKLVWARGKIRRGLMSTSVEPWVERARRRVVESDHEDGVAPVKARRIHRGPDAGNDGAALGGQGD